MPERYAGVLRGGVVLFFCLSLVIGLFVPLYTDEVGWRFQERAWLDGVDKMFADNCGPNSLAVPPFFMLPVRFYSATFNTLFADPLFVRLSGIGYALLLAYLLVVLIRRLAPDSERRTLFTLTGFGLLGIGLLPWLMVLSRPEQPVLLAAITALCIIFPPLPSPGNVSARSAWLRCLCLLALGIVALSYHMKGVLLAPLFLLCIALATPGRSHLAPRFIVAALLVAATFTAAEYWMERVRCPNDPVLAAAYAQHNVVALLGKGGGIERFVWALFTNADPAASLKHVFPPPNPMSNWMPPDQIGNDAHMIGRTLLKLFWRLWLVIGLFHLGYAVRDAISRRTVPPVLAVALCVLVLTIAWSASQSVKNAYEASFVMPLLVVFLLFALSSASPGGLLGSLTQRLARFTAMIALISPLAMLALYAPSLARAAQDRGYIADQPFSQPVFGYGRERRSILAAAKLCNIDPRRRPLALLIDDTTYFAMMPGRLPQHYLGVLSVWKGSIDDPVAYLRSRNSAGAILGCHQLPQELRAKAKRVDKYCCLDARTW